MTKKTVLILFGGQSPEHEVSKMSANTILDAIDKNKYFVLAAGITKDGRWLLYNGDIAKNLTEDWEKFSSPCTLINEGTRRVLIKIVNDKVKNIPIDVVFPVLHGAYGEDGTVQGMLEMLHISYVGCGVLASSIAMDKSYTKKIAKGLGIKQADYIDVSKEDFNDFNSLSEKVEGYIGFPCFVKPSNTGSSVGISKVKAKDELYAAIELAFAHSYKVIIEKAINGMELEVSVLGYKDPTITVPGQVLAGSEFYDYNDKYINGVSKTIIPAPISENKIAEIKAITKKIYEGIEGFGLSRVDFFMEKDTEEIYFNEINTLPGFTKISMYFKLLNYEGMEIKDVIDKLIDLAFERPSNTVLGLIKGQNC